MNKERCRPENDKSNARGDRVIGRILVLLSRGERSP